MSRVWAALLVLASPVTSATAQSFPLVVNECSTGSSGWIELLNRGITALELTRDTTSCWFVDDADGGGPAKLIRDDNVIHAAGSATCATFGRGPRCGVVAPGEHVLVKYAFINTSSADACRLTRAERTGTSCGRASDSGVGGATTGGRGSGTCFGRAPGGGIWGDAALSACTPNAANGVCPSATSCIEREGSSELLLTGTVVTPDNVFEGEVLVSGDQITCAAPVCSGDAAAAATRVHTGGIILPGMIDTHNHIQFDIFDETDWAPEPTDNFTNHDQWPNRKRYKAMVDAKQALNGEGGSAISLGCEMVKYGELKALVAGTTSVVGAAIPTNKVCYGSVARTIDQTRNGLPDDRVQAATLFPRGSAEADAVCRNFANGRTAAYLIHIAEGVDDIARREFDKLLALGTTPGCLFADETSIVHGTALGETHFKQMAEHGMGLVWSPRSNIFLYGHGTDFSKTTDIPAALEQGLAIALAPDWSIGGSQNLLDELRFADQVDARQWDDAISQQKLVQMVTTQPAEILGLADTLGRVEAGYKADLTVISGDRANPYAAILAATPERVSLVMVGGEVQYGDASLQALSRTPAACEPLDMCGGSKFLCIARPNSTESDKFGQTYQQIQSVLQTGMQQYDDRDLSEWNFAPIAPLYRCAP